MKPKLLSSLYILILPCGIRSPMFSVNRKGGRDHSGIAGDIERNQQIFCVGHFVGHFHPGPRASRTGRGAIGRQDIGPNDVLIIAPYNAQVFGLPPDRGAARSYEKVREQTKIQVTPSVRVARGRHGIDDDRASPAPETCPQCRSVRRRLPFTATSSPCRIPISIQKTTSGARAARNLVASQRSRKKTPPSISRCVRDSDLSIR
jgi:hypothetical protein